jgi:regulatory protein
MHQPTPPPPDAAALHEAALAHLARYAATEAGMLQVLHRRIDRWARRAEAAGADREMLAQRVAAGREAARQVVARLAAAGAVNDAAFAESRARRLGQSGRSRSAVLARLAAKGVEADTARAAVPEDAEAELAAALILARRRRFGPFRADAAADPRRELAALARAGFPRAVATRALGMPREEAEALVTAFRRN